MNVGNRSVRVNAETSPENFVFKSLDFVEKDLVFNVWEPTSRGVFQNRSNGSIINIYELIGRGEFKKFD
jgi:hypothetical protein